MRDLNPIVVIAGFIVLLAILVYYLQSGESKAEKPSAARKPKEKNVVKVRDYEAQYEAEQKEEKSIEGPFTKEPLSDPVTMESEIDDIALLAGVGPKYQELLRSAGYKSIKAVADSTPEDLHTLLLKTNEEMGITKRPPTLRKIEEWIKSAGSH